MAYVKYTDLSTPNDVLSKIAEFVKSKNYTVVEDMMDDLNIYDMSSTDGKRLVFKNKTNSYFINMRSANGVNIFGDTNSSVQDKVSISSNLSTNYSGIGMTVSEGYSKTQRWYAQYNVPVKFSTTTGLGVYMPIATGNLYTLYCNEILSSDSKKSTLIFTIMKQASKYHQVSHLVVGDLEKYDTWDGGIFFSGSANIYTYKDSIKLYDDSNVTSDSYILPILSSGPQTNTFLRINIDEAPTQPRGYIYWASSGTDSVTGKPLSLPIRVDNNSNGNIPHYYYLQSHSRLDWGRNVNTLNCITINLPLYMAVRVDPDVLNNYAAVGSVIGIYFISTLNLQAGSVYEINYPKSNDTCQAFPMGRRRGTYGFDGISIKQ